MHTSPVERSSFRSRIWNARAHRQMLDICKQNTTCRRLGSYRCRRERRRPLRWNCREDGASLAEREVRNPVVMHGTYLGCIIGAVGKDAGRQPDPQMFYLNRKCGYTSDVLQVRGGTVLACVEHGVKISWGIGNWFSLRKSSGKTRSIILCSGRLEALCLAFAFSFSHLLTIVRTSSSSSTCDSPTL
jgi:hypothetical protein